jgi:hypothetical protein
MYGCPARFCRMLVSPNSAHGSHAMENAMSSRFQSLIPMGSRAQLSKRH